jgi:hypothetical protein
VPLAALRLLAGLLLGALRAEHLLAVRVVRPEALRVAALPGARLAVRPAEVLPGARRAGLRVLRVRP